MGFLVQAVRAQPAGAHAADLFGDHQSRQLQDPHVLFHARQGHLGFPGQIRDGGVGAAQMFQDAAADGVGDRGEGRIQPSL